MAQLKGPSNDRTAAGARVTKSRQAPSKVATLPAISVYTGDEAISDGSAKTSPRELERVARVEVVGWVVASEALDDALDALALQIEAAMDLDLNLDGCAFDSVLESTAFGEKLDGERPLGAVSLTYAVTYHTDLRAPAPADDFAEANARISLAGVQAAADQANDSIDVPII